ncbi:hypothetical protein [Variovorax sp. SRS16]|uniref:hypothetical protein n=1 Tax=Variovorax sp. SRS16 TaxID=282217 RepID=UPI003FCECBD8
MEIDAHSLHAGASIEIPKIDRNELGRALHESKRTRLQQCRQTVDFSHLARPAGPPDLPPMNRRFHPVTLLEATEGSPTLASLAARARDASERLRAVEDLIPPEMRSALKAGPAEGNVWCVLVTGSAAAAKLRQLAPSLQSRLKARGWDVETIRIKVQSRR